MGIYREEDVEQLVTRPRNSARDDAKAMVQVRGLKVASFGTLSLSLSAVGETESGTRAAAERDGERDDRSERKIGEERERVSEG